MALPTFFIIGAAKAGTTSLHYYLEQHPQVQMSANKEPNFFAGPANGDPYPLGRVETLDAYEDLFDPSFPVRGEASVSYANHPRRQGVPERIAEAVPDARFIYVVRDPVSRAISHYQHRAAWMGERRPPSEVFGDLSDPCNPYLCQGFYARQLEQYLNVFPAERMMVIDQADLLADRREVLRGVFSFLSVDEKFYSDAFERELLASRQRRVYHPRYTQLIERHGAKGPLRLIPRRARLAIRAAVEGVLWPALETAEIDAGLRRRLEQLYAGDVKRLSGLTGKAFPSWSV
jgi:Sulfotransferase family